MILNVILLSAIYTLITIFLLSINDIKHQILIFLLTLVVMSLFCGVCSHIMKGSQKNSFDDQEEEEEEIDNTENIKMEIKQKYESKCLSKHKPENNDILHGYVGGDCLDDGTCVIKPDKANMFPGYVNYDNTKNNQSIEFPYDNLDLSEYSDGYDKCNGKYDLISIGCHRGGTMYGHYFAITRKNKSLWLLYNDDSIHQINNISDVLNHH